MAPARNGGDALSPIARRTLADDALLQLRAAVRDGGYRPGDHLRQEELAARLGVSRTPLRSALVQLQQEGLVEETVRGFRVALPEDRDVLDLFEICAAIEGITARLAAERIDDEGIGRLEQAVAHGSLRPSRDPEHAPTEFHDLVAAMTGNPAIRRLRPIAFALTQLASADVLRMAKPERSEQSRAEHREILDAIKKRDGKAAENAARKHTIAGRDRLARALRDAGPRAVRSGS